MINYKELNIDNYVYIPETKQIAQINAINKNVGVAVNNGLVAITFDKLEPIVITEDVLLNSDFKIHEEEKHVFKHKELEGFRVYLREHENETTFELALYNYTSNELFFLNDTKYFHEIQNIFSVINNYEFELKLDFKK